MLIDTQNKAFISILSKTLSPLQRKGQKEHKSKEIWGKARPNPWNHELTETWKPIQHLHENGPINHQAWMEALGAQGPLLVNVKLWESRRGGVVAFSFEPTSNTTRLQCLVPITTKLNHECKRNFGYSTCTHTHTHTHTHAHWPGYMFLNTHTYIEVYIYMLIYISCKYFFFFLF